MTHRIVVLASGGGTNCQALLDACESGDLDAAVVAIVTNNAAAGVVRRAALAGVPCHVVEHRGRSDDDRRRGDEQVIDVVHACRPDLVVLAGWMRILGAAVGARFPIVNLHPAKPGEFAGVGAIDRAFHAWSRGEIGETGLMVHWVPDEGVDVGPVIATRRVGFEPTDTLETFEARMHEAEHELIVEGVRIALSDV